VSNLKFADDLRSGNTATGEEDYLALTSEIQTTNEWATLHQLPLSQQKCCCFRVGRSNPGRSYELDGKPLPSVREIKDLGVWHTSDLKPGYHCTKIVNTAFQRLAIVRRCFTSASVDTRIWAFKVFVRPILEYACPVWSPHLLQDIDLLESVQRNFTRGLPGFRALLPAERLRRANLEPLELRRLRADLLLTYRIVRGLTTVDFPFFDRALYSGTRGHSYKLQVQLATLDCRKYFFSHRVVPVWNSLPEGVVSAASVYTFKRLLKAVPLSRFLKRSYT
jgi:hypothetical protein